MTTETARRIVAAQSNVTLSACKANKVPAKIYHRHVAELLAAQAQGRIEDAR